MLGRGLSHAPQTTPGNQSSIAAPYRDDTGIGCTASQHFRYLADEIDQFAASLREGSKMTVYVAEISGRGIVAFDATSDDEAKARLADKVVQRDLLVFQNEGRALWDGVSEIHLRSALPNEAEIWRASRASTGQLGDSGDEEHGHVFLIPAVDPSRFDDDDDDDHDHGD